MWFKLDTWVRQFFLIAIIIIIIKLSIRIIPSQIRTNLYPIIHSITSNEDKLYEEKLRFGFYLGLRVEVGVAAKRERERERERECV